MPLLRLALIVVFAVLLPLRGVVAAASWCSPGHHEARVSSEGADAGAHAHGPAAHSPQESAEGMEAHSHAKPCHGPADPGRCGGCSATCCASALWHEMPQVPASQATGQAEFPAVTAPLASHPCGGLERPPRDA